MSLTKVVNGIAVVMSAQEEAEILAEWDANAKMPHPQVQATLADVIAVLAPDQQAALNANVKAKAAIPNK